MDSARAAAMSWPDQNPLFSRLWGLPPPLNEKRPPPGGTSGRASDFVSSGTGVDSAGLGTLQRMLARAARRAADLDRQADLLLSIGRHAAAERLSRTAFEIREAVL